MGCGFGVPAALGIITGEWVEGRLGGYVRLSLPERRAAVAELTGPGEDGGQGLSKREAAEVLGVSEGTVRNDSRAQDYAPEDQSELEDSQDYADRVTALPDDFADRVEQGVSLPEAERVVKDRERRIAAWTERVREGLRTFARMAGYPVPAELDLTPPERDVLDRIIKALEGGDDGFLG